MKLLYKQSSGKLLAWARAQATAPAMDKGAHREEIARLIAEAYLKGVADAGGRTKVNQ